ncbi:MAG: hypothetical protein M1820_007227 [Bogoriella megaspora]|nr:MAG: hypothetical protein M1820_007227 [Bogoriella megaspora]
MASMISGIPVPASFPPPSMSVIHLAIAELTIYALFLPPMLWITWKHGKAGLMTWQIFVSFLIIRYIADISQIVDRKKPNLPNAVSVITNSGSIATLILTLIGIIFEANVILPSKPRRWTERAILVVSHIVTGVTIGIATAGGAPDPKKTGLPMNPTLEKVGFVSLLVVLLSLFPWAYYTRLRIKGSEPHPNCHAAMSMLWAAVIGIPFELVRVLYGMTYAFDHKILALDPIMGTFLTKFELIFLPELGVAVCVLAGGWLGMRHKAKAEGLVIDHGTNASRDNEVWDHKMGEAIGVATSVA